MFTKNTVVVVVVREGRAISSVRAQSSRTATTPVLENIYSVVVLHADMSRGKGIKRERERERANDERTHSRMMII